MIVYIVIGVVFLYIGGEALVRGAYRLSIRLGITTLVAGLTVVSFSTSMPEGITSLMAQIVGGYGDIALGNIIGSNIANVGLVLGLATLIRPLHVRPAVRKREMPLMLIALIALTLCMLFAPIGRWMGLILVILLLIYLIMQIYWGKETEAPAKVPRGIKAGFIDLFLVFGGVIGLIVGGYSLVEGAVQLATKLGLSNRVIAISVVAIGTSLPELAATLIATLRRHDDIAFGNVIGSNVFNALFITGVVALVRPIFFTSNLLIFDAPVMLAFSLLLWLLTLQKRVGRLSGALLLILYAGYIVFILNGFQIITR